MKRFLPALIVIVLSILLFASCDANPVRGLATSEKKAERLAELADNLIDQTNAIDISGTMYIKDLPANNGVLSGISTVNLSIRDANETASIETRSSLTITTRDSVLESVGAENLIYKDGTMYMSSTINNALGTQLMSSTTYSDFVEYVFGTDLVASEAAHVPACHSVVVTEGEDGSWTVKYYELKGDALIGFVNSVRYISDMTNYKFFSVDVTLTYSKDFYPRGLTIDFTFLDSNNDQQKPLSFFSELRYHNSNSTARLCSTIEKQNDNYKEVENLSLLFDLSTIYDDALIGEIPNIYSHNTSSVSTTSSTTATSESWETASITDKEVLEFELTRASSERVYKFIHEDGRIKSLLTIGERESTLDDSEATLSDAVYMLRDWLLPLNFTPYMATEVSPYGEGGVKVVLPYTLISELTTKSFTAKSSVYIIIYTDQSGEICKWQINVDIVTQIDTEHLCYTYSFDRSLLEE